MPGKQATGESGPFDFAQGDGEHSRTITLSRIEGSAKPKGNPAYSGHQVRNRALGVLKVISKVARFVAAPFMARLVFHGDESPYYEQFTVGLRQGWFPRTLEITSSVKREFRFRTWKN